MVGHTSMRLSWLWSIQASDRVVELQRHGLPGEGSPSRDKEEGLVNVNLFTRGPVCKGRAKSGDVFVPGR